MNFADKLNSIRKQFVTLLFSLFMTSGAFSQDVKLDVIFVVDEKIVTDNISNVRIIFETETGSSDSLNLQYWPGNLTVKENIFESPGMLKLKNAVLKFEWRVYKEQQGIVDYAYEIKLGKGTFSEAYIIYYIYNLDNLKYKKKFSIKPNEKYIYEIKTGSYEQKHILRG
jgi:hypothetical protein